MIFLTYWFYVFAVIALTAYWLIPHKTTRLVWLLVTCAVFHTHFAGPAGVIPIVVLAVLTYLIGLTRSRHLCVIGIAACVAALLFYKYSNFLCLNVVGLFSAHAGQASLDFAKHWQPAAPPLAISFFAFEFIHYLYDIRLGSPSLKNPLHFANFAIFWPSIVAGPIKRYEQFVPAMEAGASAPGLIRSRPGIAPDASDENRRPLAEDPGRCPGVEESRAMDVDGIAYGLLRVTVGFIKKAMADNLTAYLAHNTPHFADASIYLRWAMLAMLSLRILWDFSGYSDMAIGFARMLGIRIPENFNWPYLADSLVDFWRRWHISLSTWIRDYVYIPLGGSRRGVGRKIFNGLFAFALCGLWHGAAWNFVAWGIYHGVGLAIVSSYRALLGPVGSTLHRWLSVNRVITWGLTMFYVAFGWLLFFYPLPDAWRMFKLLFGAAS